MRALSGASPLIVTSTVRDDAYQRELVKRNREATRNYSLHTTGWAFDIARRYVSHAQALAFQSVLDRLQVLNVIAWAREPEAIHITASPSDAKVLLPLLDRLATRAVTDAIRTPDVLLEGLPGFPWEPRYRDGRRAAARARRRGRRARRSCSGTASRRGASCGARCARRCSTPATA